MGVKRLGVSGHGSAPLHEYGVYAVNPVFGPALPVVAASQQYSTYVCRASLAVHLVLQRTAGNGHAHVSSHEPQLALRRSQPGHEQVSNEDRSVSRR